jgi:hypothetical protein
MAGAYAWKRRRKSSPRKCSIAGVNNGPDLFDLALVIEREPDALAAAADALVRHRSTFLIRSAIPIRH